jgi:parallel beta-helix repeat protein
MKTRMLKFQVGCLFLISLSTGLAETFIAGAFTSATWTLAGSPYIITADATCNNGETLTIQAGVVVKSWTNARLQIDGTIIVQGTAAQPVLFTADSANWEGLFINGGEGTSSIDYCTIEKANGTTCAALDVTDSTIALSSCTIRDNPTKYGGVRMNTSSGSFANCIVLNNTQCGFYLNGSSPTIINCTISNNGDGVQSYTSGVYGTNAATPQIRNSLIANNSGRDGGGVSVSSAVELLNCTIVNNKATSSSLSSWGGIYTSSSSIVRNCIVAGNINYLGQIQPFTTASDSHRPAATYCVIDEAYSYGGTGNRIGSPLFKNPTTLAGRTSVPGTADGLPADFSLQVASLGVNHGYNAYATALLTDIAGQPRIHDVNVDVGCYEYIPGFVNGFAATIMPAVRIECDSEVGRKYRFWYSDDPSFTNSYLLGDVITGTGGRIGTYDIINQSRRFYRVTDSPN